MPPISSPHTQTRTISIGAPPARVFDYLSDPQHLPTWAPAFATAVTHESDDVWRIQTSAGEQRIAVRPAGAHGVVDIVSPEAPERGLFTRVIPSPAGSELIFSLSFPGGSDSAAVEAQMRTIEQELDAVRQQVERAAQPEVAREPGNGR